jgi:hypothetical protein
MIEVQSEQTAYDRSRFAIAYRIENQIAEAMHSFQISSFRSCNNPDKIYFRLEPDISEFREGT